MNHNNNTLPRWNLDTLYTAFDDQAYRNDLEALEQTVSRLNTLTGDTRRAKEDPGGWFTDCTALLNRALGLLETLESYIYCRYTTATTDQEAIQQINRIEELSVPLTTARAVFRETLGTSGIAPDTVCADGSPTADYRFFLEEELEYRKRQMPASEEDLAADLARAGASAWGRLQDTLGSTESVVWDETSGERKTIVQLRTLAYDPDRSVREKAYRCELEAWKRIEIPMAYALNGVKGFSITMNHRRGHRDTLERAALQNRISLKTLDALTGVMEESLPIFTGYLKTKARLLGLDTCAFFDLFAPIASDEPSWSFKKARNFILERFYSFSAEYGDFGKKAFEESWIDSEPRPGKVGGAFCTSFSSPWESRILCNFDNSFNSVTTLAHELGHAYHHYVLDGTEALLRDYPMTLAETASIFSENIVYGGLLSELSANERLPVLESYLQDSCQVIVDILSRFIFEKGVFERRKEGELSPGDFCDLMIDAQKKTYGDGLDPEALHRYMWAVKGHYYNHELAFYNFPYAFGLLFGLGLYGRYVQEGPAFTKTYRTILENTGRASAVEVARKAGFDIEDPEFWRIGIGVIATRAEEFRRATGS